MMLTTADGHVPVDNLVQAFTKVGVEAIRVARVINGRRNLVLGTW